MGIDCIAINYESYNIFDVVSDDVFYLGVSGVAATSVASWKIKKFWTINGITKMGFPDGCQSSKFVWDERTSYTYK